MQVTYIKLVNISNDETIMNMVSECLSFMSQEDFDKIVFDELNDDVEIAFAFLPEYIINKFVETLKKYNLYISHQDITSSVLTGSANDSKMFTDVFTESNIDKYVLPLLENYLRNNLTKDIILDKILDRGIESLSIIDKDILQA